MRLPAFLTKAKKEEPDQRAGLCRARTGLSSYCTTAVQPGQPLCDFHKNLAGPWSRPERVFEKVRR